MNAMSSLNALPLPALGTDANAGFHLILIGFEVSEVTAPPAAF